jgi:hypothetical protein
VSGTRYRGLFTFCKLKTGLFSYQMRLSGFATTFAQY